jgi:hypothetical protein
MTDAELEMQSRMVPLGLLNFKNGGLGEFVKGKSISFAIEGLRRFRPPSGLGMMRFDGCLVIVFGPAVSIDEAEFLRAAANSAIRFEESGGCMTRALPQDLPEWKHVNTNAPVWGLRHYSDTSATGVAFSFRPAAERKATVAYLSGKSDARRILSESLMMEEAATAAPREVQNRLRQPAAGVLEASIDLTSTETVQRLLFGLMAMVGHAIYV